MKKYKPILQEKEFKSYKEFISWEGDANKGDFTYIKNVKDQSGTLTTLKITNMGLDSSWRNVRYKIEFFVNNKKVQSQSFKNLEKLETFLQDNNLV